MCGVVAIFHHDNTFEVDQSVLEKMNVSQHHRGPDDSGYYCSTGMALAHTRLSIIDLKAGHQPLFDSTQRVVVSFNGEIYNFKSLRAELCELGFEFQTESDTEVIVNAWLAWQVECVTKFNGMFAFVLWDQQTQQCFAARDRLGIKPLHWASANDGALIFASELKALTRYPQLPLVLNPQAIEDYLSLGYILEPKSIYQSVQKLLPGHYLLLQQGAMQAPESQCYWDVKDYIGSEQLDYDVNAIHTNLSEAIQTRMIADVPLGAFLSGGLDSSAIVALMNQLSVEPIITSSIGFDLSQYDESYFAEKVAQHFETQHATTNVSVNDLSLVDMLVDIYDEPFADNSAIPTLILSKVTREKVKVALSGDGSDELFFGYRNYQMLRMEQNFRRFIPNKLIKPLFGFLAKYYPKLDNAPRYLRAKSTFQALSQDPISSFHQAMSLATPETIERIYSYQFKQQLGHYRSLTAFQALAQQVPHLSPLKQVQYIDFKTYLPGDILTKVDRASMANSLEVRVPFLDHKLVEWGLGLHEKLNFQGSKVKQVLVNSLKGLVPKFVLNRQKMGFTSPLDEWIRQIPTATLEKRIFSTELVEQNIFNIGELKKLISQHQNRTLNNGVLIWALLILTAFLKKQQKPMSL